MIEMDRWDSRRHPHECLMVKAAKDRKGWRSVVQAAARGWHRLDSQGS